MVPSSTDGDIAIVGIGCRLPGGANSPDAFWRLLRDGIDAITEMPADRFDLEGLFDADATQPAKMYTRWGGFMDAVDGFDSAFFGLSPREVVRIDPQHRLLLEVTWEALEDAGLSPDRMAGTAAGVFIGISTHDYGDVEMYPINRTLLDGHSNSGTAAAIAANRISYHFDFRGPSLIVDTACSSSLTAVHLACQSIRSGESTCAVAGGVQLLLAPELTMGFCRASMLSPDGRCRAFDARANGYVRSEGAGVVVLRPVADALANGDPIYAVIKASAINQDGHTNGLTVPSADAQEKALRQALRSAGLTARNLHYVEAHGPGTPVGDPIEAEGLGAVMRDDRGVDEPCLVGSVKTNIGHLEAASGIAGLIKTALAIRHRLIPASLHYQTGNPAIDFAAQRLRVVTELTPWPGAGPATAGLNSFGFGGANAHVILQEAPARAAETTPAGESTPRLLLLSSRSADGLRDTARACLEHIQSRDDLTLRDLTWTSALRRAHLDHRLAVAGIAREDFLDGLDAFLAAETRADVATGRSLRSAPPKLAFVFSGMGPQWWGMGRQLMAGDPCFRDVVERCDAALRKTGAEWSLIEELMRDELTSRVSHANFAQVTNFAVQAALSALWRSWGIRPAAVMGHSAGEIAAAWTAGAFDLETGVRLAYHRGRLQALATGEGKMLAVGAAIADIEPLLRGRERDVSLAAVNSPTGITLAGDGAVLEEIRQALEARQAFARFLPVDVPYHSPKMDKIEQEIRSSLADLELSDATIPMVSIVSGDWTQGRSLDAAYWWRNIRQPVLFSPAIEKLIDAGFDTFVEVGPHPVLAQSMRETLANRGVVLPTLRRMEGERHTMLRTLGALHVRGCEADLAAVYGDDGHHAPLPTYRWQRERHWFVSNDAAAGFGDLSGARGPHPLLSRRLPSANPLWETPLGGSATAYLDDHLVQGAIVYPGAAYVETALGAARALAPDKTPALRDVAFHRALFLPERDATRLQFSVTEETRHFEVHSLATAAGEWSRHASGLIAPLDREAPVAGDLDTIRGRCHREMPRDDFYALVDTRGVQLQDAFRGIQSIWLGEGEAVASIATQGFDREGYEIHPALLDAIFQPLIAAAESLEDPPQGVFLPVRIGEVILHSRPDDRCWSHARVTSHDEHGVTGDVHCYADDGTLVVTIRALGCTILESSTAAGESVADWLYDYGWEPQPLETGIAARSVIASDATTSVEALTAEADRLAAEWEWDRYYTDVEPRLDALARSYVVTAVRSLGFAFDPGVRIDLRAFAETHRVAAGKTPLLRSMFGILTDHGALARDGDGWLVVRDPQDDERRNREALTVDGPRYELEIELLNRCGRNLTAVLRGEIDSGTILFADESFDTMRTFYREAPTSRLYNVLAGHAVGRLTASMDRTRPLRVLEIGGGTGGTTIHVLPHLPSEGVDYLFTDVSPFFTQRAIELFGSRNGFSTRVFDVEGSAGDQGLASESFDLVIASNVLHTTKSVAASLAQVEGLLAPGGSLVLMEITRHPHWIDLIFGLTDGWWRFADHTLRADHPILPEASWRSLLVERGWSGVEALSDTNRAGEAAQTVLAARWEGQPQADSGKRWLVFADDRGVASKVIERLDDVVVVRAGEAYRRIDARSFQVRPGRRDDLVALFRDFGADARFQGTLHFWSLDAAPPERLSPASLRDAQRTGVESVLALLHALGESGRTIPELWIVTSASQPMTSGPEPLAVAQAPIWGFSRVITQEQPEVHCRAVDLSAALDDRDIAMLMRDLRSASNEDELAYRDGTRFVRRLRRRTLEPLASGEPYRPGPEEAWQVEVGTPGVIGSIGLRHMTRARPGPGEVEIRVVAASLNFREVVLATDAIPGLERVSPFLKRQLGVDCAGVITAVGDGVAALKPGDEVVAFASGTHRAFAITSQLHVLPKPAGLTFEGAASIPGVFLTAHYALRDLARIRRGDRVLIHAATGGVGLAAIEVARDAGAEIFATAGSPEKRAYLASIGVSHVMNSRTLAFADEIMSATAGRGVDIVLNSLAGEAMSRSMSVLAPFGRFVEIGKKDLYADSRIAIGALRHNIAYHTLDLDLLVAARSGDVRLGFVDILERVVDGRYRLPPVTTFPFSRTEDAVRLMAQSRHIGKIVLTTRGSELEVLPAPRAIDLSGESTVLITGGMGGFGFACAERLARLGVRHLVLAGRGQSGDEHDPRLAVLQAAGATASFIRCDVTDAGDVARMFETVRATLPPLRGIVHAAMVLDDAPLAQLDADRLDRVIGPKAAGAWNLHQATEGTPLEFFVMFSSLTSLMGNPLQANYAAANGFLDALCYYRRASGLAAQTINWGVLSGIGWVAAHGHIGDYLARQGYLSFSPSQALQVFEELLRLDPVHVMAARIDWKAWMKSSPAAAASPRMRYLAVSDTVEAATSRAGADQTLTALLDASAADRPVRLEDYLRARVGRVLGIAANRIDRERRLTEMGLDSLIAVELMTVLKMELSVGLPVVKLLQGITIVQLATMVEAQLAPAAVALPKSAPASMPEAPAAEPEQPTVRSAAAPVINSSAVRVDPPRPTPPATGTGPHATFRRPQRIARRVIGAGFRVATKLDVEGLHHFPASGRCIVAANHLSLMDVPLIFAVLPRPTVLFASEHLRSSIFMRRILTDFGDTIWVRRGEGDQDALQKGLSVLEGGGVLGIGPEGTRSQTGRLGPAHTGPAYLAARSGAPILPIAVWGQENMGRGWGALRRPPIHVRIGAPIVFPYDSSPDGVRLAEMTGTIMKALAALLPAAYRGVYAD